MEPENGYIGYLVGGSLKDQFSVRLTVPSHKVQEGSFVVVEAGDWRYYGLATDLMLGATDARFADEQSEMRLPARLAEMLHTKTLFTNLQVMPNLMQEIGPDPGSPEYADWRAGHPEDGRPQPVKTVPPHHAQVRLAEKGDVAEIFGTPDQDGKFVIGYTPEQGHPVCVDLDRLVLRSSGIFGATGTGKSFLTRILLAGLIRRGQAAVLLFDMHNEYAFQSQATDSGEFVPGLKDKFGSQVRVAALGRSASIHGNTPDFTLEIAMNDITTADIEMLAGEMNLPATAGGTLSSLYRSFQSGWFRQFRSMEAGKTELDESTGENVPAPDSVEGWARANNIHEASAQALHRRLDQFLFHKDYIVERSSNDAVDQIISALTAGRTVILSFGKYENDLDYLLVTNLLTRRIREEWKKKTEQHRSNRNEQPPKPLVIAIEEAHKLLTREMAVQTSFSVIAREMRKYFVTLLVIDQRPSQIDDEIMSQLGTRISAHLGDEADIQAVLAGLAGRDVLRGMLARLREKEELLLLGWGVPMPILVRSRRYNAEFWKDVLKEKGGSAEGLIGTVEDFNRLVFGS